MPAAAPRSNFEQFLSRALQNVETRTAYEDSQARHRVIDSLVRLRARFGLTQTGLAHAMGVKQPTVSGFETEGSDPRLSTLQRYARAVDASIWISVVPNASAVGRPDFYFESNRRSVDHAERHAATDRAATWAHSDRRYRHLAAVPDRVPA